MLLVIPIFFLISISCYAQDPVNSRQSSYFTFIYKISDRQARILYNNVWKVDTTFLQNLYDFFPTDSTYRKTLPVGHYVFVKTVGPNLKYELKSVDNLAMNMLHNRRDLIILFNDPDGRELDDVNAAVGSKKIPFESGIGAYRLPKTNKQGIVSANYQGHISYFKIERSKNRRLSYNFSSNHVFSRRDYIHRGMITFNKPAFKPYDTVRLKGILLTRKGKLTGKNVKVYIEGVGEHPKILGTVSPFRKGAYQFEFVLSDTLNLKLDWFYSFGFKDLKGHTLLSTGFHYEDYTLKNNRYDVRTEQENNKKPAVLYLKGEDTNHMPLFDARAEILLKPGNITKYYKSRMFVPDTLWFHIVKLDAIGETRISVPDSIMPPVAMTYDAVVSFYNSSNERTERVVTLTNDTRKFPVTLTVLNDSLRVTGDLREQLSLVRSRVSGVPSTKLIRLPYAERIDPFVRTYSITNRNEVVADTLHLGLTPDKFQLSQERTADSVIFRSENPRRIPFRFFLFRNNDLIETGATESLNIARKAKASDDYSVSVGYMWGGAPNRNDYYARFDKRNLEIKLDHPDIVYPGQKAVFKINVKDGFGEPVQNVDLTAYAVSKKFEQNTVPNVPSFSEEKYRKTFNDFLVETPNRDASNYIDWPYWKKALRLDTIAFYKLVFPAGGYYEYRLDASTSQVAPIVVRNGKIDPAEVIYVDGQPVYYRDADTREPYSFHISPGDHTIAVRVMSALITVGKVRIESNQKLIFSVDRNHLPAGCIITKMPFHLSTEEREKLSRYFMVVGITSAPGNAYIQQGKILRLMDLQNNRYRYNGLLVGPMYPGPASFTRKDAFHTQFEYQPFFSYDFAEGQLIMRERKVADDLKNSFLWTSEIPSFKDQVRTLASINSYWRELDDHAPLPFSRFPDFLPAGPTGRLTLIGQPNDAKTLSTKAVFVVDLNNPDNYFILEPHLNNVGLYAGTYQAVVVYTDQQYLKADSIQVKANGVTICNLESLKLHPRDTLSVQILNTIRQWSTESFYQIKLRRQELQKVRERFYQSSSDPSFNNTITGKVVSPDGSSLPGVNVIVKGTPIGTVTDSEGNYHISCPANSVLVFSFIGLVTEEAQVIGRSTINMELRSDVTQLSEVVVTGYALEQVSRQFSGAVRGFSTTKRFVRSPRFRSDQLGYFNNDVLHGDAVFKSAVLGLNMPSEPEENQEDASSIKRGALEEVPGNALRKNFRDYAFWKPALVTDQNGEARFEATFPDDITGWNAYVIGVTSKRTGQTGSAIKSYKPLLAQIAQPLFLIDGDSAIAIGKITNYAQSEIHLDRTIRVNSTEVKKSSLIIKDSKIDSIRMKATGTDSLEVFYSVTHDTYSDGELRKIPVYPPGVKEAVGKFMVLEGDTTMVLDFKNSHGPIKLYAQANLYDVVEDEIRFLKDYPYDCNEQMASRLIALLMERKVSGKRFENNREILKAIRKLSSHQSKTGSWSWWGSEGGNAWITLHVAKSLDLAKKEGFELPIDTEALVNYLETSLAQAAVSNKIAIQTYLLEHGGKVEVRELVDSVQRSDTFSFHDKLAAQRIRQLSGERPDWTWINSVRSTTIKGNSYWADGRKNPSDNPVLNTLLVYKMIEKENPQAKELSSLRNYFLEHRAKTWATTYESSLILEAIMPRLLSEKTSRSHTAPALKLSGIAAGHVNRFPFEQTIPAGGVLTIAKSGTEPVYFTAYEEFWNSSPSRSGDEFNVRTRFADSSNVLVQGRPANLLVKMEARGAAEYVMIEVPIPAGCSYASKPQSTVDGEVHREYYNNKVNIYCENMRKGTHWFTIPLLPRYAGAYTINPATATCMYFPTLNGREGLKKVVVK